MDKELLLVAGVSTVFMIIAVLGVYTLLRFIGSRYNERSQKIRVVYATYSIPILLALIFGLSFYHNKMGYVCDAAGNNTAGWTCSFSWLLIPLLLISIPISWVWIRAYRRPDRFKNTVLDSAGRRE